MRFHNASCIYLVVLVFTPTLAVVVGRWSTFQQSNTCTFEQTRVSELSPADVVASTNSHLIMCLKKVLYMCVVWI